MSFIENIKHLLGRETEKPKEAEKGIALDPEGHTLYKSDIIAYVQDKLAKAKQERHPFELQWQLNANFLAGNQFVDINVGTGTIEEYPKTFDYQEREVYNQIAPLYETRLANLEKISYLMTVRPSTSELSDYQKARVSTELLRHEQISSGFTAKINAAIAQAELQGTAFILSWWDPEKGELIGEGDIERLGSDGSVEIQHCGVHEGDIAYGIISSFEVYPESCYKENISDQRYIILEQAMNVGEIYDRYGVHTSGSEITTFGVMPRPNCGGYGYEATVMSQSSKTVSDAALLVTYFERPSRDYPTGRLIIYCGDELIHYGALPMSEIPLVAIKSKIVSGQFFGKSVIQDLIPLQRKYNGVKNCIGDYIHTLTCNGYLAEDGSVDVDEYEENGSAPGSILTYKKGYQPPIPKTNAPLPPAVTQTYMNLRTEMEYVAGVSQLMVSGTAPNGITSGVAMQNLQQIDNTRLSLTGNNIRNAVLELAKLWLRILRANVIGYRACRTVGSNNIGDVLVWCCEDINSFDIEYCTENELVLSPEAKKQLFIEAFNLGAFTNEQGIIPQRVKQKLCESLRINDFSELSGISELQEKAAGRENAFFREGIIPEIHSYDDHNIHIDEHMRFVLQAEFILYKNKSPKKAEEFLRHIELHRQALASAAQSQMLNMQGMIQGAKKEGE